MNAEELTEQIQKLAADIAKQIKVVFLFLVLMLMVGIKVLAIVAPFILRILAVMAWLAGTGLATTATWNLEAKISSDPTGNALVTFTIGACIFLIPGAVKIDDRAWGSYAVAAGAGLAIAATANNIAEHPEWYALARLAPQMLATVIFILIASQHKETRDEHARPDQTDR